MPHWGCLSLTWEMYSMTSFRPFSSKEKQLCRLPSNGELRSAQRFKGCLAVDAPVGFYEHIFWQYWLINFFFKRLDLIWLWLGYVWDSAPWNWALGCLSLNNIPCVFSSVGNFPGFCCREKKQQSFLSRLIYSIFFHNLLAVPFLASSHRSPVSSGFSCIGTWT